LGNVEKGLSNGDFERWMKGAVGMERLSLKRLSGGVARGGGDPSLETLEDMLRKAPDTVLSLHRGLFTTKGNLEFGGGAHIPGTLKDE
jgi:hypothetical protein